MFQKLVSHNNDLKRLVEKGYAVSFDSNYLIIRDIPYLDKDLELKIGAFVVKLIFVDEFTIKQEDHQILFAGSIPYNLDRTPIANLAGGATTLALSPKCSDVVVERSFSNKPTTTGVFPDFYEKIESYLGIIAGPAMHLFGVHPYTYRIMDDPDEPSVFKFRDTLTSRAEITDLSAKFKDDVIAVIGLGGTGSYLLDFLVKTPVREIKAFDSDEYYVHNSFRSPGRLKSEEFGTKKAEIYQSRYENFRHGLSCKVRHIDQTCEDEIENVTFAFVCVDKGSSRAGIFDLLMSKHIPFIDVGMGLKRKNGLLNGMLRTTYFPDEASEAIRAKRIVELNDSPDDIYKTNIQIGELNALNACLAIIKYKQLRGFYLEDQPLYHLLFGISDLEIVGDSLGDEL
jgi:hypothetical protein